MPEMTKLLVIMRMLVYHHTAGAPFNQQAVFLNYILQKHKGSFCSPALAFIKRRHHSAACQLFTGNELNLLHLLKCICVLSVSFGSRLKPGLQVNLSELLDHLNI